MLDPILSNQPLEGWEQFGIYLISVMLHQGTVHVPDHGADPPVGEDRWFESADIRNVERRPQAAAQPEEPRDRLAGGRQPGKVSCLGGMFSNRFGGNILQAGFYPGSGRLLSSLKRPSAARGVRTLICSITQPMRARIP